MVNNNNHFNRGLELFDQGKFAEARLQFIKGLSLNPNDAESHNELGRVGLIQQHYVDAENCFRRACELNAGDPAYRCNLGLALGNQNRYPEAEKEYQAALNIRSDFVDALNGMGGLLLDQDQNRYVEAKAHFVKALTFAPNNPETHNGLGRVALVQQLYGDAEISFRKACELNAKDPTYRCNLGLALANQNRYTAAAAEYRAALGTSPDSTQALNGLGDLLLDQDPNRHIEAKAYFDRALAIDSNDAETHNGLGRVALIQQDYRDAASYFRKACELNPGDPVYQSNLELALENQTNPAKAK